MSRRMPPNPTMEQVLDFYADMGVQFQEVRSDHRDDSTQHERGYRVVSAPPEAGLEVGSKIFFVNQNDKFHSSCTYTVTDASGSIIEMRDQGVDRHGSRSESGRMTDGPSYSYSTPQYHPHNYIPYGGGYYGGGYDGGYDGSYRSVQGNINIGGFHVGGYKDNFGRSIDIGGHGRHGGGHVSVYQDRTYERYEEPPVVYQDRGYDRVPDERPVYQDRTSNRAPEGRSQQDIPDGNYSATPGLQAYLENKPGRPTIEQREDKYGRTISTLTYGEGRNARTVQVSEWTEHGDPDRSTTHTVIQDGNKPAYRWDVERFDDDGRVNVLPTTNTKNDLPSTAWSQRHDAKQTPKSSSQDGPVDTPLFTDEVKNFLKTHKDADLDSVTQRMDNGVRVTELNLEGGKKATIGERTDQYGDYASRVTVQGPVDPNKWREGAPVLEDYGRNIAPNGEVQHVDYAKPPQQSQKQQPKVESWAKDLPHEDHKQAEIPQCTGSIPAQVKSGKGIC